MFKISGRHTSVPNELKRSLTKYLDCDTKVVMIDICSCRHRFTPGDLRLVSEEGLFAKIRGYHKSGVVNFFVKFSSEASKQKTLIKFHHS